MSPYVGACVIFLGHPPSVFPVPGSSQRRASGQETAPGELRAQGAMLGELHQWAHNREPHQEARAEGPLGQGSARRGAWVGNRAGGARVGEPHQGGPPSEELTTANEGALGGGSSRRGAATEELTPAGLGCARRGRSCHGELTFARSLA